MSYISYHNKEVLFDHNENYCKAGQDQPVDVILVLTENIAATGDESGHKN